MYTPILLWYIYKDANQGPPSPQNCFFYQSTVFMSSLPVQIISLHNKAELNSVREGDALLILALFTLKVRAYLKQER